MNVDSSGQLFILRSDVVATPLEREAVLLDLATKFFYSVNPSGWAITQLFEAGASPSSVKEKVTSWNAVNGDIEAVSTFIQQLVDEKLVVPADEPAFDSDVSFDGNWTAPKIEKHREPLHRVMVSAFDPTLPLAE